jgi:hypothetical protein
LDLGLAQCNEAVKVKKNLIKKWKMLNSASGLMVKHIKIENLSRKACIQHFGNVKNCFPNIKFLFYFFF